MNEPAPQRERVELSAGTIEYLDTGGDGPAVVLLHGVLMDGEQWREVVPRISGEHRCIVPTLPLGGHRIPMRPGADLTLAGQARLVAELLGALDLRDVTLCFNDWAAPQILVAERLTERIGGMVLVACETAGNYPPGLPGKNLGLIGTLPGGLRLALGGMRIKALRRTPVTFGWMSKRGVPDDLVDAWLAGPWSDRDILRDARAYISGTREARRQLVAATERLGEFDRPVTVVWATEDKVMPMSEGEALAAAFPDSRLELVDDSYVLIPIDRPERLAELIRAHAERQHSRDEAVAR